MPLQFDYPLEPTPPVKVYEHPDPFPSEPAPEVLTVALPAAMLPLAVQWNWTPQYPIVVFTGPFWGLLARQQRDLVWDKWGVPVFEYRLDIGGKIAAEECDAHEGLHLRAGLPLPPDAIHTRCGCGLSTPRIEVEQDGVLTVDNAAA